MADPSSSDSAGYGNVYREFDSPLMQRLRGEAYGKDIGQHSWATAEELVEAIPRLKLTRTSRLLDLGCGPCGPLTFLARETGCQGFGADFSAEAIAAGRARAAAMNLGKPLTLQQAELNDPLPVGDAAVDAVLSVDVVLHLRDRLSVFREVVRVLCPGGRFLFTDAAVLTAAISEEEIRNRAIHRPTHFVPPGYNEHVLEAAGLRLLEQHDRTANLLQNATGRLTARLAHRAEVEKLEGAPAFARQVGYLEGVIALSQRGALSRIEYLAEPKAGLR